jgi:hypothetical protein
VRESFTRATTLRASFTSRSTFFERSIYFLDPDAAELTIGQFLHFLDGLSLGSKSVISTIELVAPSI